MAMLSALGLLSCLHAVAAQGAAQIGGAPPQAVQMDLCSIGDVYGKLNGITSNEQCRSGCAQGICPTGWMPTADDECSPECGRVFEPFCAIALPRKSHAPPCLLPNLTCDLPPATYLQHLPASLVALTLDHGSSIVCRGPVWRDASAGAHGRNG